MTYSTAPPNHLPVPSIPPILEVVGQVVSSHDLLVEGVIKGNIHVPDGTLTIAKDAVVHADIRAKVIRVYGTVHGTIAATERIEIETSAFVRGDVSADHVVIKDGAVVNGHIDMNQRTIALRVQQHAGGGSRPRSDGPQDRLSRLATAPTPD